MTYLLRSAKQAFTSALEARGYSSAMVAEAKREGRWWLQARARAARRGSRLVEGRVVLWNDGGTCELVPAEIALAGRGEVTIETIVSAVSPGTERAQFLRLPNAQISLPYAPGYSLAGRVIDVGRGVRGVVEGDVVAAIRAPHASVVTVPARDVFTVAPHVRPESAALIRLGIVAGAGLRAGAVEAGKSVLVLGAGPIGVLAARRAVARGAGRVTIAARTARHESWGTGDPAVRFHVLSAEELPARSADVVIDATGDPEAVCSAVEAAAVGGRVVLLGSPRGITQALPVDEIRAKEIRLVGAHVALLGETREREEGVAFLLELAAGSVTVDDLVGEPADPREAATLYRRLARSEIGAARFTWGALPQEERRRRSRLFRAPDLSARGVEPDRKRLSPRPSGTADAPLELPHPFTGASGRLRIALVGCGEIAVRNAEAAALAPNVELVACFDTRRDLTADLAAAHDCRAEPSFDAVLDAADVDAVFLCLPHHLHASAAIAGLEAGKHVIVEKPLANDLGSALEIAAAAERARTELSVCFPFRYEPRVEAARRLVAAGALGELVGTLLGFLADKPESYWFGGFTSRTSSDWRASRAKAGGGILIMNLCHYIDLLRYLTGDEPAKVLALTGAVDRPGQIEDSVAATLQYEGGAIGTFFGSSAARGMPGRSELRLWGSEGHVVVEPDGSVFSERALPGLRSGRWHTFGELPCWNSRAVYLSRFASAVAEGRTPDVTLEDALAVQKFVELAYASAASDRAPADVSLAAVSST